MIDGPGGLVLLGGAGLDRAQHVGVTDDGGHRGFEFVGKRAHEILALPDIGL